jgi:YVTN family beta-propeller protein
MAIGMTRTLRGILIAASMLAIGSAAARADIAVVMNSADDTISILSTKTYEETSRVNIGRGPHHFTVSPDRKDLIIGNTTSNELVMLDPATGAIKRRVQNIADPYQLGFSPNHKWFVTTALRLNRVDIYSGADMKLVKRVPLPDMPSHLAYSPDSRQVFITLQGNDKVAAIDLETQAVRWTALVGSQPAGIWWSPAGQLWVGIMGKDYVAILDPKDGKVVGKIVTGKGAHQVFPSPDGKIAYISNRVSGTITLVDVKTQKVLSSFAAAGGPDCMEFMTDRRELWVTARFKQQVHVYDLDTGKIKRVIAVGRSPHGIFLTAAN